MGNVDQRAALEARHRTLEQAIAQEETRLHPDDDAIHELKKRKLAIKDQIARLSAASVH